jgi:hypothetical protein
MFYTYLWLREDGTPYYVGKGKGNRAYKKHRVKCPPTERIIIQEFECEDDAFFAEKFLIALYGRTDNATGCLSNLTDGGEGQAGVKYTEERRSKVAKALTGRPVSKETRKKIGLANKGKPSVNAGKVGPENHMFGKTISTEQKESIRKANLGNTHCAGIKNHTTPHSAETKAVLVAKTKALWENPEFRARMMNRRVRGKGK